MYSNPARISFSPFQISFHWILTWWINVFFPIICSSGSKNPQRSINWYKGLITNSIFSPVTTAVTSVHVDVTTIKVTVVPHYRHTDTRLHNYTYISRSYYPWALYCTSYRNNIGIRSEISDHPPCRQRRRSSSEKYGWSNLFLRTRRLLWTWNLSGKRYEFNISPSFVACITYRNFFVTLSTANACEYNADCWLLHFYCSVQWVLEIHKMVEASEHKRTKKNKLL